MGGLFLWNIIKRTSSPGEPRAARRVFCPFAPLFLKLKIREVRDVVSLAYRERGVRVYCDQCLEITDAEGIASGSGGKVQQGGGEGDARFLRQQARLLVLDSSCSLTSGQEQA